MAKNLSDKPSIWQRIFRRSPSKNNDSTRRARRQVALRDGVAVVFLSLICFLAIFQKMEILAIVSMMCIGAVVFKYRITMFLTKSLEVLDRAKVAKVGDLELTVEQKNRDYSKLLIQQDEWLRIIVSELTSDQIGMLIAVYKTGKHEIQDKTKDSLRALRGRGLLFHNAPTMAESTEVWLSDLGNEIASRLTSITDTSKGNALE